MQNARHLQMPALHLFDLVELRAVCAVAAAAAVGFRSELPKVEPFLRRRTLRRLAVAAAQPAACCACVPWSTHTPG
jgi:hypothetical protein